MDSLKLLRLHGQSTENPGNWIPDWISLQKGDYDYHGATRGKYLLGFGTLRIRVQYEGRQTFQKGTSLDTINLENANPICGYAKVELSIE